MTEPQTKSSDWDCVLDEIEEKLLTLSAVELYDVCIALSLTIDERDKDSPRKLRRLIIQYLESDDVNKLEDEGLSLLLQLSPY